MQMHAKFLTHVFCKYSVVAKICTNFVKNVNLRDKKGFNNIMQFSYPMLLSLKIYVFLTGFPVCRLNAQRQKYAEDWQKREMLLSQIQCSIAMQFFSWMVLVFPILLIPRIYTKLE